MHSEYLALPLGVAWDPRKIGEGLREDAYDLVVEFVHSMAMENCHPHVSINNNLLSTMGVHPLLFDKTQPL